MSRSSPVIAGKILLILFGCLSVFHLLVLIGFVPTDVVWAGHAAGSTVTLLQLELSALLGTILFAVIVAARIDLLAPGRLQKTKAIGSWIVFLYLVFNAITNFAAASGFERLVFGPLSALMAVCALMVAAVTK
jgi:hypothetical protein